MPKNKNALIRYKVLDDFLSDRHHYYDIHDLTNNVNKELCYLGYEEVTQRCIEKDLNFLEYGPFHATLERAKHNGRSCIGYEIYGFSIFTKEMSREEENILSEIICTLGQFEGLDNFTWLDNLKNRLGVKDRKKIICFSSNPYLRNSNMLSVLFDAISNRQVLNIEYKNFISTTPRRIIVHPYLLKQYNDRWYLIGNDNESLAVFNLAVDRIEGISINIGIRYLNKPNGFEERFEDIIGVTLPANTKADKILFWISDKDYHYIETKPLHGSQCLTNENDDSKYRSQHPQFNSGKFVRLNCIINYELRRDLCSFGDGLIVLEPKSLRNDIKNIISAMNEKYSY